MTTATVRQLDIFAQLVASGSVTGCARDMGISRSTVERGLRALEARIGHRLFEMKGGEAMLTATGEKALRALQMLSGADLDDWGSVETEPAAYTAPPPVSEDSHRITIAAHPAIFGQFQEALNAFEETNPDISISLSLKPLTAATARAALASGAADIAYFHAVGPDDDVGQTHYCWSENLVLFIGAQHMLAGQSHVDAGDLDDVQPLLPDPANPLRPIIEHMLGVAGIEWDLPAMESDQLFNVMTAVQKGAGYFPAFGPTARDFGKMPGVRRLPFSGLLPQVEVRQALREDEDPDSLTASLADYLRR